MEDDSVAVSLPSASQGQAAPPCSIALSADLCLKRLESYAKSEKLTGGGKALAEERLGSFNFWTRNIGAFAQGNLSADYRLEYWPKMRNILISLLELLLKCVETIDSHAAPEEKQSDLWYFRSPRSGSAAFYNENMDYSAFFLRGSESRTLMVDSDFTEPDHDDMIEEHSNCSSSVVSEPEEQIDEILVQLHDFLVEIRRRSRGSQNLRASSYQHEDIESFRQFMDTYMERRWKPEFPLMPEFLGQRMVATNVKRRNRLEYMISHSQRLAEEVKNSVTGPAVSTEASRPLQSTASSQRRMPDESDLSVSPSLKQLLSSTFVPAQEVPAPAQVAAPSQSVSSSVVTAIPGKVRYPKPPLAARDSSALSFNCPYCSIPLRASLAKPGKKSKMKWESHVKQDLQPYICIFQDCTQDEAMYTTRKEWLLHMSACHSKQIWTCRAKPHTESLTFEDETSYRGHLTIGHPGIFSDKHVNLLVGRFATRSLSTPLAEFCPHCPICGWKPDMTLQASSKISRSRKAFKQISSSRKKRHQTDAEHESLSEGSEKSEVQSDSTISEESKDRSTLVEHIAEHLHEFALLALPLTSDDESCQGSSQESSSTGTGIPRGIDRDRLEDWLRVADDISYSTDFDLDSRHNLQVWEAARATSAAPSFFQPTKLVGENSREAAEAGSENDSKDEELDADPILGHEDLTPHEHGRRFLREESPTSEAIKAQQTSTVAAAIDFYKEVQQASEPVEKVEILLSDGAENHVHLLHDVSFVRLADNHMITMSSVVSTKTSQTPATVLIEYKPYSPLAMPDGLQTAMTDYEVQALANMLDVVGSLHVSMILPFKGIVDDPNKKRATFVFDFPAWSDSSKPPRTLYGWIRETNQYIPLTLFQRCHIAQKISWSMRCFHKHGWLHGSMRSGSVCLFVKSQQKGQEPTLDVSLPYLVNFQYSHQDHGVTRQASTHDIERGLYQHVSLEQKWDTRAQYPPHPSPLASLFGNLAPPQPEDVVVALMGLTGVGKSTFISLCTDKEVEIGHGLQSTTQKVSAYRVKYSKTRAVYLLDTPSFGHDNLSDAAVLKEIASWLASAYQHRIELHGIIYLHRISDTRMGGSAGRNLSLFKKLCGPNAFQNVVIATTMWEEVREEDGQKRLDELTSNPDFWGAMITGGSQVVKHYNNKRSALEILDIFAAEDSSKSGVTLDIQTELVIEARDLVKTSAGAVLLSSLAEQRSNALDASKALEKAREQAEVELEELKQQIQHLYQQEPQEITTRLTEWPDITPTANQPAIISHPQRQEHLNKSFTKFHDIYALGVILLELGLWKTAAHIANIQEGDTINEERVQQKLVANAKKTLGHVMGISYAEAVVTCLSGELQAYDSLTAAEFAMVFRREVIAKFTRRL